MKTKFKSKCETCSLRVKPRGRLSVFIERGVDKKTGLAKKENNTRLEKTE
jgi:hypothetical protein